MNATIVNHASQHRPINGEAEIQPIRQLRQQVICQHSQYQRVRLPKLLDSRNGELGRRRANEELLLDVITAQLVVETGPADLKKLRRPLLIGFHRSS